MKVACFACHNCYDLYMDSAFYGGVFERIVYALYVLYSVHRVVVSGVLTLYDL